MPIESLEYSSKFGGNGGGAFTTPTFVQDSSIHLVAVRLWGGSLLDAIELQYSNGVAFKRGGGGGSMQELVLQSGEHIAEVSGRSGSLVDQLKLRTSRGREVQAGGSGGSPFSVSVRSGTELIGANGSAGRLVDSLVFVMRSIPAERPDEGTTEVEHTRSFGGNGGSPFPSPAFLGNTNVRLLSVRAWGGSKVDAIQFMYSNGGNERYGGGGGSEKELILGSGEYIGKVTGRAGSVVDRLCFHTNKGRSMEVGGDGGSPFEASGGKPGWEIIGASGSSGSLIDRLSFACRQFPALGTTSDGIQLQMDESHGGNGGAVFGMPAFLKDASISVVAVRLWGGTLTDAVEFEYSNGTKCRHGGGGGAMQELKLLPGEFLQQCTGRSGSLVDHLSFATNKGRSISAGGNGGGAFQYFSPPVLEEGVTWEIAAVTGRSGSLIDRISVVWRTQCDFVAATYKTMDVDWSKQRVLRNYDNVLSTAQITNRTATTQNTSESKSFSMGNSTTIADTFTRSTAYTLGVSQSIKVGVGIEKIFSAESTTTFSFSTTDTTTTAHSKSVTSTSTTTATVQFNFSAPPNTRVTGNATGSFKEVEVPYTATIELELRNGGTRTIQAEGTIKGTSIQSNVEYDQENL